MTVATVGVAALWFTLEYPGRLAAMITSNGASASPDAQPRSLNSRYLDLGGLHSSVDPTSSVETARADRSKLADRSATRAKPTAKATSTKPKPSPTKASPKPAAAPAPKKAVAEKPAGQPSPVKLADGRPNFQSPFTCGERWRGTTYANHNPEDKKIDFFYQDGETRGRDVRASAPGVVNRILPEIGAIKIYHGDRWYTMYNHMDPILVEVGQKLAQGELVGKAGSVDTGVPHLHYEQIYDADNDDWGSSPAEIVNPIIQEVRYSLSAGDEPIIKSTNNC
ncbi:M23 family metallopeptidase [Actinopolymorpha sp. B17G11]|uniref:M23 family metallopeptidase n=1 Tax=Actinopolymorpha sp. B9G3 TaxID=3158970 RepID=UPI0032D94143